MKNIKLFIPAIIVILLDQTTKILVDTFIPVGTTRYSLFGDFLRIVHVRNDAVAFSIGSSFDPLVKVVLFIILPLAVLTFVALFMVREKDISQFQRILLSLLIGGGIGNLIDRIFRHMSVVDFISTNNYGLFGMDRFPTYNIADASVVISVILLFITFFFRKKENKN